MAWAASLIPGLDDIVKNGDPRRCADAAEKISELFLQGAAQFQPAHVDLFDGILTGLVPHTEIVARADLSERLSLLGNAPPGLVEDLASQVLRHVGYTGAPVADLTQALEQATASGTGGGQRRCDVQFRAHNDKLEILVSSNGGRIWQETIAIP